MAFTCHPSPYCVFCVCCIISSLGVKAELKRCLVHICFISWSPGTYRTFLNTLQLNCSQIPVKLFKVVGLTLTSSLWKQITWTCSYLLTNNCHRLEELMFSFQKLVVRGDSFHTSGGKSHLNCRLKNKSLAFYGLTF